MVKMTKSLQVWLFKFHREKLVLISFGHTELFTEEMQRDYLEWCKTDEGREYLVGGSKYSKTY